ncbi:THUMP-like domain-containing protein [Stackebrandtia soli]|uniref:class I SAM-dependent methyltransferase n=1 Tax=Stackebrandtia soli TaxID=1892856 RepID=UPI0039ED5CEB
MDVEWLTSTDGADTIAIATRLLDDDPDRAGIALARVVEDPHRRALALTQAQLRGIAVAKFGPDAAALYYTRDGLEQASRRVVADRRARLFVENGARVVADLCCGIGADAFALARVGLDVEAVDADAGTAALAAANASAIGLADRLRVHHGDALHFDLSAVDSVFCDPARRKDGRRVFDPRDYSPPLDAVWSAAGPRLTAVKVAPGIAHDAIPDGAAAEWVSVDGDVVEAALWRGRAGQANRTAVVFRGGEAIELTGTGRRDADVGGLGEYVYEPDGAVIRARLVAELGDLIGARLAHPTIAYLYRDAPATTPLAVGWRIREVLPFHVKKLRGVLRERGIGRLTIKKRGADVSPDKLRRELRLSGADEATLIVTRDGDRHVALLCDAAPV